MKPPKSVLVLLCASAAACSGASEGSPVAPASIGLVSQYPIDGQFDFASLPVAPTQATIPFVDHLGSGSPTGKVTTVRWVVLNDDRDMYVAVEWDDASFDHTADLDQGPTDFDGIKLVFDDDGDGTFDPGEDERTILAASVGSQYIDQHAAAGNETDLVGDGLGRLSYDEVAQLYRAEFLIPLGDDAQGEDGPFDAATRYTFLLFDHARVATLQGNVASLNGTPPAIGAATGSWDPLPIRDVGPYTHPTPPADLTGLIAFVSRHEAPNGEIYTFDPATRTVFRVTHDPSTFKDNVSLSHDRTRIAFQAAPAPGSSTDYEIYTIGVDGGLLIRLTNNLTLDGHPAWSLDDQRLAFASQRNGTFHIVLMSANAIELADLTPNGTNDNDPDWLADGRIVFKTDRFSLRPELRVAVMDDTGAHVEQLTFVDGVSDHDVIGAGGSVLFERFPKDTDYSTDIEASFTPWDIVEVATDLSGEHTLLHDPWVNWLPVPDPSGAYIAHVKTVGYSELHLISRDGRTDYGRLIPGITRITYVDWK